jgi:hypothetical protein
MDAYCDLANRYVLTDEKGMAGGVLDIVIPPPITISALLRPNPSFPINFAFASLFR